MQTFQISNKDVAWTGEAVDADDAWAKYMADRAERRGRTGKKDRTRYQIVPVEVLDHDH